LVDLCEELHQFRGVVIDGVLLLLVVIIGDWFVCRFDRCCPYVDRSFFVG